MQGHAAQKRCYAPCTEPRSIQASSPQRSQRRSQEPFKPAMEFLRLLVPEEAFAFHRTSEKQPPALFRSFGEHDSQHQRRCHDDHHGRFHHKHQCSDNRRLIWRV